MPEDPQTLQTARKRPQKRLQQSAQTRLVQLVRSGSLSVREAHRRGSSEGWYPGSYQSAVRAVRQAEAMEDGAPTTQTIAGRMLALVSSELVRLERQKGPADLERLERLARTLGQIARLSPQKRKSDAQPGLASLLTDGDSDGDEGSDAMDAQTPEAA